MKAEILKARIEAREDRDAEAASNRLKKWSIRKGAYMGAWKPGPDNPTGDPNGSWVQYEDPKGNLIPNV